MPGVGPNLRFLPAMMLLVVLAGLVVAVPPPWAQCPTGMWGGAVGRVRAEAPVPDWAREGLWLCSLWLCHCLQAGAWEQRPVLPWGRLAASPVGSLLSSCWLL